jgi:hypothetical protein
MLGDGRSRRHHTPQKVSTIQVHLLQAEPPHQTSAKRISVSPVATKEPKITSDVQSAQEAANTTEVQAEPQRNGPLTRSFEPVKQSLRELSQAKLGGSQPKDALTQGIANAGITDCLKPPAGLDSNVSGLLVLPSLINDALKAKCH